MKQESPSPKSPLESLKEWQDLIKEVEKSRQVVELKGNGVHCQIHMDKDMLARITHVTMMVDINGTKRQHGTIVNDYDQATDDGGAQKVYELCDQIGADLANELKVQFTEFTVKHKPFNPPIVFPRA
jgi:uncharacterized protein (UPF0179 family)